MRRLALLCTGLMACTTVRTPVSTIGDQVPLRAGRPEPQVELWVESDRPLTPAEEDRARAEAREALTRALEGRAEPEGDALLVLRAQGVSRTPAHRRDQAAATAGAVVGAVVVVAAVVVAMVSGGKGGSSHPRGLPSVSAAGARGVGRAAGRAPGALAATAVARAPLRAAIPAPGRPSIPAPGPGRHARPSPALHGWHGGPPADVDVGRWWSLPLEPEEEPGPPLPAEPAALPLPPPPPFPVAERGFFAGDRLSLEAILVDRETGAMLWVKRLDTRADPRDARAVRAAVDQLLAPGGWLPPSPDGN